MIRIPATRLLVSLVIASLCLAASGGVVTATDHTTVAVDDGSTDVDSTTTVPITLSSAPDGLAGYKLTVSVANSDKATITGVSVPDSYNYSTTETSNGGSSATAEAIDTHDNITAGATDVTLATVELRGEAAGDTELSLSVSQMDDDDGAAIEPATSPGTLSVSDSDDSSDDGNDTDENNGTVSTTKESTNESAGNGTGDDEEETSSDGLPFLGMGTTLAVVLIGVGLLAGRYRD